MCQFLLGKVQQGAGEKQNDWYNVCQFLLGKVQQENRPYPPFIKMWLKCQFLLGKVQQGKKYERKKRALKMSYGKSVNSS